MVMFDLLLGEAGVLLVSAQHQGLAWFWEIAQALTASTTSSTRHCRIRSRWLAGHSSFASLTALQHFSLKSHGEGPST